ncbi:MAG: altronate dehydratase family protein [Pirellulales bacterium]|nr:altronate dehydratase family protein [Pirellulales bacterium]
MSTTAPVDALHLHPSDNIAVAARSLPAGTRLTLGGRTVELTEPVAIGHKAALVPIPNGERVLKYGQTIGFATQAIPAGAWVHSHNLAAGEFARDYMYAAETPAAPAPITDRTFQGYRRPDGRVGTRNYLAVISNVNCSATVARIVAQKFDAGLLQKFPNVDGILPITHKTGCGLQYKGEDHAQLNRVLSGFARHPNIGGYLLVGLGCETATLGSLVEAGHLVQISGPDGRVLPEHATGPSGNGTHVARPITLSMQDLGGTTRTVEAALEHLAAMLPHANDVRRASVPASELVLGTNCGGSDGNSGVTANPALGVASDMVVAAGGTTILAETPEIYGAEHLLTRRAVSRQVGERLVELIRWWEEYTGKFGVEIDNNPSPGNKEGGLTTIYEKSLGAVAKAGSTAMTGVYRYAEQVTARGFVVMDTPGFDPPSVTGIVAGGANVVCFTTGRGSCFGCKPTPSIKVATNTPMYERMIDDMDVNAGVILAGTPVAEVGRQIFDLMLEVASGRKTKSELLGYGEEEFVPWSIGPTL